MEFNKLVFPSPSPSYTPFSMSNLMWIPRSRFFSFKTIIKTTDKFQDVLNETRASVNLNGETPNIKCISTELHKFLAHVHIPILYHSYYEGSNNYILYFHGNAEDIGLSSEFTKKLSTGLKVIN